jgi:hypothetical protein
MSVRVIQSLALAAMEAYKSVPRRGLEIGGVLLGRNENREGAIAVFVDEYDALESEHRSGPSYQLSETDLVHLKETLRGHRDAVGMFRTHTRSEELHLEDADAKLFRESFAAADGVFLLIGPVTGTAALYVPEEGELVKVHEFPFRVGETAPVAAEEVAQGSRRKAPRVQTIAEAKGSALPLAGLRPLHGWKRWVIPAAALVLGAALTAEWNPLRERTVAHPGQPQAHVTLHVQQDGRALRLTWDRDSPAIRSAGHGLLHITDGRRETLLHLLPQELETGVVSYSPDTDDITFRLEVFTANPVASDSIRFVGSHPGVSPASVPERQPEAAVAPTRRPPKPAPSSHLAMPRLPEGGATREVLEDSRPSPFAPRARAQAAEAVAAVPAPNPQLADAAVSIPAAPPIQTRPNQQLQPGVTVTAEVVEGSWLTRTVSHVPLLRRLRKPPQDYVPPKPRHQVLPVHATGDGKQPAKAVPVDVRVYIGRAGDVQSTELVSGGGGRDQELASAALSAARQWSFSPARMGQENVPSEMVLHFLFEPPPGQ